MQHSVFKYAINIGNHESYHNHAQSRNCHGAEIVIHQCDICPTTDCFRQQKEEVLDTMDTSMAQCLVYAVK